MDFEKICMMFTMQEPYYGILLSSMERIPTTTHTPTMCVSRSGNVFKLYYNTNFTNTLDVDTTLEAIKHELLHIALNHFTIWNGEDKNDDEETHIIRNIAADLEVNCYINKSKMQKDFVDNICTVDKYGWKPFEGTREYFSRLYQMAQQPQPQQANAQQPQQSCNGGQGGQAQNQQQQNQQQPSNTQQQVSQSTSGGQSQQQPQQPQPTKPSGNLSKEFVESLKSFDDHSKWPDTGTKEEQEMLQQVIDDMLVFAAEEVEKGCGSVPGELAGRIKLIREKKKPKPVADWKRYFRRYLGNEFTEFIRKSKKRPSRRFPDAAGNRHMKKSRILVGIDTSGSVSMREYREFFGQIRTLTPVADFHVIECDAMIQYEYDFTGKPNENLHGGGGTNFQPVINEFNKDKKKYDALVYFTDGYASIPSDTPKDTIWVISSNGDQSERKRYQVNGASVAFIPKKD